MQNVLVPVYLLFVLIDLSALSVDLTEFALILLPHHLGLLLESISELWCVLYFTTAN